jgi:NAD(P)-dependent dehydrogenase (short-subunit alcohol dehydrogenase family)
MIKTVVVTGSTRGIGSGLADELLKRGCQVAVSGREQTNVDRAVAELAARHSSERVWGLPCDVTQAGQVPALWDGAVQRFGRVDTWISNAGSSTPLLPLWEQDPDAVSSPRCSTNGAWSTELTFQEARSFLEGSWHSGPLPGERPSRRPWTRRLAQSPSPRRSAVPGGCRPGPRS